MSTNPIGAALTRYDAAVIAGAPQIASEPSYQLTGIATAIERVEALLAAGGPEPEGPDAIERIADIAFVLHERDVEASLCDALDAAVRELANANAAKQANVHHVRQAAEMLRELSQRVTDMIALLQVSPPPAPNDIAANEAVPEQDEPATREPLASEDAFDDEMPREGLFPAELLEDDEFARAVAELAASLPALAEPVEAVVITLSESADLAAAEPIAAPEPDEAVAVAPREPASFAATEPTEAPEADREVPEARREEADVLAANEPDAAPELEEAVAETAHEYAHFAVDESVHAPESETSASEPPHGLAQLPPDEPALEQQPLAMDNVPAILAEVSPIVEMPDAQLARADAVSAPDGPAKDLKDDAISNVTPASEGVSGETPSGETLPDGADTPEQPAGSPGDSPDHSSVNGHAIVLLADTDTPHIPSELLSPPDSEAMPEGESTRAADSSPIATPGAEAELPPSSEAPSLPADADASAISEGQPLHQNLSRHDDEDLPAHIVNALPPHDVNEAVAATAAEVGEVPPRFAESSQALLPELALVDPQDDPGDLFEPLTGAASPIATANFAESPSASKISAGVAARQARSAAAADPLASMSTLSAEELLALFT